MVFGKIARARRLREERLYETAAHEIERGEQRKGLWAKALADANFDHDGAKSRYLKLRVVSLADEEKNQSELDANIRKAAPSQTVVEPVDLETVSQPLTEAKPKESGLARRILRSGLWLTCGAAAYQIVGYLVFGEHLTVNPFQVLSDALNKVVLLQYSDLFVATLIIIQLTPLALFWVKSYISLFPPRTSET